MSSALQQNNFNLHANSMDLDQTYGAAWSGLTLLAIEASQI